MKKALIMTLCFTLVAIMVVGGTLAYLTTTPATLGNVVTVGDIDILLDEEVGVEGAGSVVENDNGATYSGIMPGDKLQKEVTVTNRGSNPAYVRVDVKLNNALAINKAIDESYEKAGYTAEQIQAIYDYVFAGWGINYNPRPGVYGSDARGVIDGTFGLPENVLHVDFSKTITGSTLIGAGNWFVAGKEKAGQYWVDNQTAYDGYYTKNMKDYEIFYAYYIYLEAGESTTLFNGLNVPAEFDKAQLAMFENLKIDVTATAIQADNISTLATPGTEEYAKAAFAILAGDVTDKAAYVSSTEALVEALENADEGSVLNIVLTADVEYVTDGHHNENDITKASAVIIDGVGKYTITATGAGVTPIGDDAASLTLKNLTVADKSASYDESAWELSYLEMGGTDLTCYNVTFADPIMVESDDATFTNCTFTGYDDTTNGIKMYGAWMYNGDATFTGCTFNGTRGLKICDMYAGEVGTVVVDNCTFNNLTQKPGVAIDDEDDLNMNITIKNSTFINCQPYETDDTVPTVENNIVSKAINAANNTKFDEAIKSGADTIILGDGNYIVPDSAQGKTLKIIGNGNTVIATQDDGSYEGCDYSLDGSTVTFENVTINTDSHTYTGYARCKGTYNNCTINGTFTLYDDSEFNNCTFNVSGDVYNIWTWGATTATFNGCTFNSDGKAMLLYGTVNTTLTLNDCVFNDNGGLTELKAAVEIGNDYGKSYTLIVNNTVVNGYEINDKGINTDTTLWGNKNSMGTDKLNVIVDGVDVY